MAYYPRVPSERGHLQLNTALVAGAGGTFRVVDDEGVILTLMLEADVDAKLEAAAASLMGVVIHDDAADVPRPEGYGAIYWVGSVEPTAKVAGDLWMEVGGAS